MSSDIISNSIALARQPIFDNDLNTYAYELLFRGDLANESGVTEFNGDLATSQVINHTFMEFGIDRVIGNKLGFINLTRAFLTGEIPLPFDNKQFVLEILEDIVIDDEIINDESSGSNGRLFLTTRRVQGEGVDYQVGINLKLVLPKSRDRFKLLVETDENEDGEKESDLVNTTENVTYSTAIRIELREGKRWKSSLDNGVRWSGKPVYFSRIRARRTDYFDEWRLRVLQSVSWRTDVEWGAKFNAGLLRPIDLHRHFRTGFTADYLLSDDFAELQTSAAIFEQLDERAALLYQLAVFGDTEHIAKVSNYVLTFSYRRKIYKNFVFAEVVPEMAWPREDDYEATPAINFRFEMIIGPDVH